MRSTVHSNHIMATVKRITNFQQTESDDYLNPDKFQEGRHIASSAPNEHLNHSQDTLKQSDKSSNSLFDDFKNIRFSCKDCLKQFSDLQQLFSHICSDGNETVNQSEQSEQSCNTSRPSTVPKPEKPFSCQQCGRSFARRDTLLNHNRIHTGEKLFACKECGKSFSHQSNWVKHNRVHTGEKPYTCKECGKSFTQQHHLTIHNRLHTGEKPYSCKECGKSFSQQASLTIHNRIHTGEQTYTCKECGNSFSRQYSLIIHNRSHTGEKSYTCNECGKSFSQRSNLVTHNRVHTGEKPYSCNKCGKSFTTKYNLNCHDRLHTRVKSYKCQQCEQSFIRSDLLRIHLQRYHADSLKGAILGKTIYGEGASTNLRNRPFDAPYKCQKCSKGFALRIAFNKHVCSRT